MRKYWAVTFTLLLALFAFVLLLPWAPVAAQQAAAGSVKVTPSAVTRVTLIKVNPGQRPAFDQDVMDNLIPVYEDEHRRVLKRLIVDEQLGQLHPDFVTLGSVEALQQQIEGFVVRRVALKVIGE